MVLLQINPSGKEQFDVPPIEYPALTETEFYIVDNVFDALMIWMTQNIIIRVNKQMTRIANIVDCPNDRGDQDGIVSIQIGRKPP